MYKWVNEKSFAVRNSYLHRLLLPSVDFYSFLICCFYKKKIIVLTSGSKAAAFEKVVRTSGSTVFEGAYRLV